MSINTYDNIHTGKTLRVDASDVAVAILGLGFLTLGVFWSPSLSYWWDEFSLIQAHQKGVAGVLDGHMGHFLPIGRTVLWLETLLFGSSYHLLILVNGLVLLSTVFLIRKQIFQPNHANTSPDLGAVVGLFMVASVFSSSGIWYDLQWGMQICWFLAVFFGVLASTVTLKSTRSYVRFYFFILLSWLSLGSTSIAIFFIVIPLSLQRNKLNVIHANVYFFISLFLTYMSSKLAFIFPPVDSRAAGWPTNFAVLFEQTWDIIRWTLATTITWLISPMSLFLPSQAISNLSVGTFIFRNSLICIFGFCLLFLLVLAAAIRMHDVQRQAAMGMCVLLVGLVVSSLLIVVSRIGNTESFLHIRYAPILQIQSMLFYIFMLQLFWSKRLIFFRISGFILSFLLIATITVSVLKIRETVSTASELSRIRDTKAQLDELEKCAISVESVTVYPSIQPALSNNEICEISATVRGLVD
jgi:hypothetical protein